MQELTQRMSSKMLLPVLMKKALARFMRTGEYQYVEEALSLASNYYASP